MDEKDRFLGCLLGLATGDAVGTALEFQPPGSFTPISDMVGGGPFDLAPGEWTDDTSMALCLATSLVETGRFDAADQMSRYCRWVEEGYLSSNGRCVDIGGAVSAALRRFQETGDPFAGATDHRTAGNGCIMRLALVPMFCYPDEVLPDKYAAESSRTTHGAAACMDACRLLAGILIRALAGHAKEDVLFAAGSNFTGSANIVAIARGEYRNKAAGEIRGTGYVVKSLEAALWCFLGTETFEEAILRAANLGDDADTTAAVCGQVAGAYYRAPGIPERWLERLVMRQQIADLAHRLFVRGPGALGILPRMRDQRRVALPTSWKTKPMNSQVARLPFQKTYSAAEFAVIARGNIPESMDDRWFAYMQAEVLYIHRSWTGICIYQVRFQEEGGCFVVKEALAERDSAEYDSADAEYDAAVLNYLIDGWLGKSSRFPTRPRK
jgi:ADP-ribosyl-[dinitrogen reductase] hydrolase